MFYGIGDEAAPDLTKGEDYHLPAEDFHRKMTESDTVVVDVRNYYESCIGAPHSLSRGQKTLFRL